MRISCNRRKMTPRQSSASSRHRINVAMNLSGRKSLLSTRPFSAARMQRRATTMIWRQPMTEHVCTLRKVTIAMGRALTMPTAMAFAMPLKFLVAQRPMPAISTNSRRMKMTAATSAVAQRGCSEITDWKLRQLPNTPRAIWQA